ncbi:MAG: type I-C CRISPR-associated protein Cas5c [Helicobacteraceae bacterium]|jgi:CRISPR-associated protein Cas5d|nr:type I-C CRISPR-associated protein Cas5c [Helicobacteraceae bacterium]
MSNWRLEVQGDYACFTRPEMKVERVSYEVMTPSAARAIFDAILWKPAIKWHILKIETLNPIRWISVRRNEVGAICGERGGSIFIEDTRQQRAGLFLRDVRYRIHARFEFIPQGKKELNASLDVRGECDASFADDDEQSEVSRSDETEAKYAAMFERRAKKGQCFHRPYLGCREFACDFRLIKGEDGVKPIELSRDLGWMLYDMDFSDKNRPKPEFFKARLENGVLIADRNIVEVRS